MVGWERDFLLLREELRLEIWGKFWVGILGVESRFRLEFKGDYERVTVRKRVKGLGRQLGFKRD